MMKYTRYDEATGITEEVEMTEAEIADFNVRLAAHLAAQEQPTNEE